MHRIDGAGHDNYSWVAEDPATNRPPTEITPDWMNAVQEEIANVIEEVEPLNKADNTQLKQAILAMIAAAATVVADATTAVKGILKLATNAQTQEGENAEAAVTPASARSNTVTPASDPTYADNSTKWVTTSWLRNAMGAIATAAGFSYSFTPNGYIKCPSWLAGFIIQWGGTTSDHDHNGTTVLRQAMTFPIAFPNTALKVIPFVEERANASGAGSTVTAAYRDITLTGFTHVTTEYSSVVQSIRIHYFAFGN